MGKIKQLDDLLSNKIAAGEVVERPASVVKELVENSIDASSTRIDIEVDEGGLSRLRITDNGEGIDSNDLKLAFQRHATSKIQQENDLFHIRTLGFRGEALPSIASVAKVEVKTSTGSGPGNYLEIQYGKVMTESKADSRKGTDITVSQLFHNTPARLKHLKTVHTELGNITDVINRLAMGHPDVGFHLKHNGKSVLRTPGNGDIQQVIAAIYGLSVAKKMLQVKNKTLDYTVSGFAVKPEITRSSRQYISLFINGRYIKNYTVYKAIEQAYHTLLPIGRYPIVVLSIELDPILVDVNVHPAKLEARFSKEKELAKAIEDGIRETLGQTELIPNVSSASHEKTIKPNSEQHTFEFENGTPQKEKLTRSNQNEFVREKARIFSEVFKSDDHDSPKSESFDELGELNENISTGDVGLPESEESHENAPMTKRVPPMYPVGQVHGTYIVAQNDIGMYIIDQHAAQERIKYEFYREKVAEVKHEVQELLVPITFEFTHTETMIIRSHLEEFALVGIFLESFGTNAFIVRSHPQWFPNGEEQRTIQEIIDQVLQNQKTDIKKLREEAAIMMSCKGSIKANRHLRHDEMITLIDSLREASDPFTCPHGRPIIVQYTKYEMEKMFKRVM
ncbi:DNA mismatch repair endonuclease MutL [Alkalihalobacillus sp. AL-G]|uniref:DNA mismatch repair endonuclease MutL n=1 Tax=Alkalihalobacillus sp. AL-G TaxID=2926399 RepID=UPI00272C1B75|nr:DNA mismatch repair endonuclease MutL [Alkalihalobacillus sp. AL-G]WLD95235.1 DNA mismatch repair endonuclease MutL [Alkalihalobacillus sp. AL-G]